MSSAAQRLEAKYQARHRNPEQAPQSTNSPQSGLPASVTTEDDLSRDRDSMQRIRWVFDRILEIVPLEHQGDTRYTVMKTMFREGIKDLALVPDRVLLPMFEEFGQALAFVANGTMQELEELLESQRDNSEEG